VIDYFHVNKIKSVFQRFIVKKLFFDIKPACKHNAVNPDGKYLLNYRVGAIQFELVLVFLPETLSTIDQRD